MNVVRMTEFRNRELVAVCRELLRLAEKGEAQGLAFVVKLGRRSHRPGLVGDYTRNPEEGLAAAFRLRDSLLSYTPDDEETQTH
jgi:hypothetical protein